MLTVVVFSIIGLMVLFFVMPFLKGWLAKRREAKLRRFL